MYLTLNSRPEKWTHDEGRIGERENERGQGETPPQLTVEKGNK
jgi:hypothetical protein